MKITEDQVMEVIESFGTMGATKKQIAKRLGVAIETPTYRAEQLIEAGLVLRGKQGREVVYIAKPKVPKIPALADPNLLKPVAKAPLDETENARVLEREYRKEIGMKPELGAPYGLDKLADEFVSALAVSITDRLRPMIIEKLSASVAAMTQEVVSNITLPKEKPKLPSIFVGGLHSDQVHMIKKEFEGVADLRFAVADDDAGLWKSRAMNANHTVMMADFLSHKHFEQVKSTGVVPITIRGGLTKLRDKLMELSV